jgi:hypothetical protein
MFLGEVVVFSEDKINQVVCVMGLLCVFCDVGRDSLGMTFVFITSPKS